MDIKLQFSFHFRPEPVDTDCSKPVDDDGIYRLYGREIERTVERVMRFIMSYIDPKGMSSVLALASGYQGHPQGRVDLIQRETLEYALVGWFTTIFFSCAKTYQEAKRAGKQIGLAGGRLFVRADQYGGIHIQVTQYEGNDDYMDRQSLDILNVKKDTDSDLGEHLRKTIPGKIDSLPATASPF